MLASSMKTGGSYWQSSTPFEGPPEPLRPPSPEAQAGKGPPLPSSTFLASYDSEPGAFKVEEEQGRVRVVSQFKQGFGGRGAERYPSGETCVRTSPPCESSRPNLSARVSQVRR